MISVLILFEVRQYSRNETFQNRSDKNLLKISDRMNKKSNDSFNMVSYPNGLINQLNKERTMRLSNATKQGAINLIKREISRITPKERDYPKYIGAERRKIMPSKIRLVA